MCTSEKPFKGSVSFPLRCIAFDVDHYWKVKGSMRFAMITNETALLSIRIQQFQLEQLKYLLSYSCS